MNQPKTFYRRPLPDTCTSFSSNDGKIHFKNAMMGGKYNKILVNFSSIIIIHVQLFNLIENRIS